MYRIRSVRVITVWLVLGAILAVPVAPAGAQRTDVVLFRGLNQAVGASGLDTLNQTLLSSLPQLSSQVFGWQEQQQALTFLNNTREGRSSLVIIGFSLGGPSALGLAGTYGLPVDLSIQIDSVAIPYFPFYTPRDDVLPSNVRQGINYYQNSTSWFEPQGERNVRGAANINTEVLFNDRSITHSSLDDDVRLHQRIVGDISAARQAPVTSMPEPGTLLLMGTGALGLLGYGWGRRRRAG